MITEIDVQEAKYLIQKNKGKSDFIVLDVRTMEEYNEEHIPSALNIDICRDDFDEEIAKLNRKKTYLVHCHSGGRSSRAVEIMEELGFMTLYNVVGLLFGH